MKNKIIVEFDRKELKRLCKKYRNDIGACHSCQAEDWDLIRCILIFDISFEIKEQSNGNKGTED